VLSRVLVLLIRAYQAGVSSWTPASCRFHPTCSSYAIEAIRVHGSMRGGWLALRRIVRCHPWGGMGYDPVPPAEAAVELPADRTEGPDGDDADTPEGPGGSGEADEGVTRPVDRNR